MKAKTYIINWRHPTQDTPEHPCRGAGLCSGRTRRAALHDYFNPFGVNGDTTFLSEMQQWFLRGELEITEMRRV